jgi:hypothetical protein
MQRITIHRCPEYWPIKNRADELANELRKQPNVNVQIVDGAKGEFTVDMDGQKILGQGEFPTVTEILAEIRIHDKLQQLARK